MMFVNISPAVYNVSETLCSLNFAARCRNVEIGPAKKQLTDGSGTAQAPARSGSSRLLLPTASQGGAAAGDGAQDDDTKSTTSMSSSISISNRAAVRKAALDRSKSTRK